MEWIFKYDPNHLNDEERQPLAIDKYYTLEEVEMNYFSIEEEEDEIGEWKLGDFIGSGSFG